MRSDIRAVPDSSRVIGRRASDSPASSELARKRWIWKPVPRIAAGYKLPLLCTVLLVASVSFAAGRVPRFDVEEHCRDLAKMVAPIDGPTDEKDFCLRQEREARAALVKQWANFPAEDRSSCVAVATIGDYPATYTHLFTCLKLKRAVRKLQESDETGSLPWLKLPLPAGQA